MDLVDKTVDVIRSQRETIEQTCVKVDQVVVVLYKKLAPKMYFAYDEHDLDLKLSGPYAQFLCSSESDSALPYNQPFIVTVSNELAMQNEQFQVIKCQTTQ